MSTVRFLKIHLKYQYFVHMHATSDSSCQLNSLVCNSLLVADLHCRHNVRSSLLKCNVINIPKVLIISVLFLTIGHYRTTSKYYYQEGRY